MKIYEYSSYRAFLKGVLVERIEGNSSYSLRAMARDFEIASSTLSEVMNGKSHLSKKTGRKIAKAMKLTDEETIFFCELIQLDKESDPVIKERHIHKLQTLHPEKRKIQDLTVEQFKQISDWYHSAILELSLIDSFALTSSNVSKALDIPLTVSKIALERLEKLGFLNKGLDGELFRVESNIRFKSEIKNKAMRNFYDQMFGQASKSLLTQTPQERLSGFLNLPLNKEALPEIDEAITRFFNDVRLINKKYNKKDSVYHLMIHFFNLTKNKETKNV